MPSRHFVADNAEAISRGLAGFCALHADLIALHPDPRYVVRARPAAGTVALVSGGGSGHEPLHAGFVGEGMLDAAVPGEVFASPSAAQVRAATLAVDNGRGVLHIVKNYTGDVINFRLAADACRAAGVDVATVVVDDDVPSAERGTVPGRRGTVATVVVEKVCGAAAQAGLGLAELQALGQRVVDGSRSVGVALRAGTAYGTGERAFELGEDEIEFGVGIHGERGTDRLPVEGLDVTVTQCLDLIAHDLGGLGAGPYLVLVNGLGSTTPLELSAAYGAVAGQLQARGVEVARALVGDLVTSLDMRGLSITLVRLDDELLRWWDAPAVTPDWPRTPPTPRPTPVLADTPPQTRDTTTTADVDKRIRGWAEQIVATIDERADELGALDRQTGDGDFGDNLRTAAGRWRADGPGHPLRELSDAFASIGGSSGPMLAVWFSGLAGALASTPDAESFARGLGDGVRGVRELGGAAPGDRTMVDAMVPAAEAAALVDDLAAGATAAAEAARTGADRTTDLVARRGRSSYLGESVRGTPDPGAVAIALFLEAAREVFAT